MNADPYEPPKATEASQSDTPSVLAVVIAVVLALFSGGVVFLGTCFTGGLLTIAMTRGDLAGLLIVIVWSGSGLLGLLTAFSVGNRYYRNAARRSAGYTPEEES